MKRKLMIATVVTAGVFTGSYAGGDIEPVAIVPMEPISTQRTPNPVYLGAGVATGRYKASCSTNCKYEDVTGGIALRVGYDYNQYIGIEARYIATLFGSNDLRGQKMQHVGLYVKPMYALSEQFNMYGLLGYGWTKSTSEGRVKLLTVDEGGFSAGLGLEYDLSDIEYDYERNNIYPQGFDGHGDQERGWGLFVDYQRLLIDSNVPDMDVVSAGLTYDF